MLAFSSPVCILPGEIYRLRATSPCCLFSLLSFFYYALISKSIFCGLITRARVVVANSQSNKRLFLIDELRILLKSLYNQKLCKISYRTKADYCIK